MSLGTCLRPALLLSAWLLAPPALHAQPASWVEVGSGVPVVAPASGVWDVAVDRNGVVYAGGEFERDIFGAETGTIWRWDGTGWAKPDPGATHYGVARAVVVDHDGNVYVSGNQTLRVVPAGTAGGGLSGGVLKWDGAAWSALGSGLRFPNDGWGVQGMAVGGDGWLYVAGPFDRAGPIETQGAAVWNGGAWSALGGGVEGEPMSLAVGGDGRVYVGGWVGPLAADDARDCVRVWDGTEWSRLGGGLVCYPGDGAEALVVSPSGEVYAGGRMLGGAEGVAVWDGTAWRVDGGLGRVLDLAVDAYGRVLASTDTGQIFVREGGAWVWLEPYLPATLVRGVAVGPTGEVFAGGEFGVRWYDTGGATSADDPAASGLWIEEARPNPFRTSAQIRYRLPTATFVRLTVHDLLGRRVATLVERDQPAGPHAVTLDGAGLPSGRYLCRLESGGSRATRLLTLLQ